MNEARVVYEKLMEVPLFRGVYDAKNGNEHFMYGISTVMEFIAKLVSEELYEEYNDMLHRNMTASEQRTEQTEPKLILSEADEEFINAMKNLRLEITQTDCAWK